MKVLVTFAVDAEFAPWRRLRRGWVVRDALLHAYELRVHDLQVCVILTGMGCARAWDVSAVSLWGSDFDVCISSGLAGALRPEHHCGDLLVAEGIRDSKMQAIRHCDPELTGIAVACGAKRVGAFFTSDRVLVTAEEKSKVREFGDAVEMEGRRVVGTATRDDSWRARSVAIRAISDEVGENLPLNFNETMTPSGDVDMRKLVGKLIWRPWTLPRLVRFGRRSRQAARALGGFLDRYVTALSERKELTTRVEVART
jgi:adenosylhomocysteine nucleosidase